MKTIIKFIVGLAIIAAAGYGVYLFIQQIGWKQVNLGQNYVESEKIKMDLNGDGLEETIDFKNNSQFITINNNEYVINKYFGEGMTNSSLQFADLNEDKVLEIVHRTSSHAVSPAQNYYTIYNFTGSDLKEIGGISISGNPSAVFAKYNSIKFVYWPFESPEDNTEEVTFELKL